MSHKSDYSSKVYSLMIHALRSMDATQYASQFKSARKAKRQHDGGKYQISLVKRWRFTHSSIYCNPILLNGSRFLAPLYKTG